MIPTTEECIALLDEFRVPENVRQHSLSVNKVSMIIAGKLKAKGVELDLDLVNAASLLHDIDKIATLKNIQMHGRLSKEWLEKKGYSKVGDVVGRHKMANHAVTWEDKVVNYADKRCTGESVVSLKERYDYIKDKYAEVYEEEHETSAFELEKEIFENICIKPEDII